MTDTFSCNYYWPQNTIPAIFSSVLPLLMSQRNSSIYTFFVLYIRTDHDSWPPSLSIRDLFGSSQCRITEYFPPRLVPLSYLIRVWSEVLKGPFGIFSSEQNIIEQLRLMFRTARFIKQQSLQWVLRKQVIGKFSVHWFHLPFWTGSTMLIFTIHL